MASNKIKIVQISNSFGSGGRENVILNLCNFLSPETFEIHLILLSNTDNALLEQLEPHVNTHIFNFNYQNFKGFNSLKIAIPLLTKLALKIKEIKPAVINSHALFFWLLIISLAIRMSNIKVSFFHTIHTSGLYYSNGGFINWIRINTEKVAFRITKCTLIAISESIRSNLKRIFKTKYKIKKIYNGIDFNPKNVIRNELIENKIKNRTCVTYVSRLDIGKNHLTLLHAWKKTIKSNDNIVLLIVGEGQERKKLETFILENNLSESVILFGNRTDVLTILSYSHIAVFPSLFEGFPIALLEKMSIKLPVIVSDIDIFKEVITNDFDGLIFEKNNADELSSKIDLLINDENLRQILSANGYNTIKKYSLENMIKSYQSIYLET